MALDEALCQRDVGPFAYGDHGVLAQVGHAVLELHETLKTSKSSARSYLGSAMRPKKSFVVLQLGKSVYETHNLDQVVLAVSLI